MSDPCRYFDGSPRDHWPGGDDVREAPAVAAQRRGPAARARDRHRPRDDPVLVERVWPRLRRRDAETAGGAHAGLSSAALKFPKRVLKKYGRPETIATDGLCSCPAATKELGVGGRREAGRRLDDRAENSHRPSRRRERAMQRSRRMETVQKFSSIDAPVPNHFNQQRHLVNRDVHQRGRSAAPAERRALAARSTLGFGQTTEPAGALPLLRHCPSRCGIEFLKARPPGQSVNLNSSASRVRFNRLQQRVAVLTSHRDWALHNELVTYQRTQWEDRNVD